MLEGFKGLWVSSKQFGHCGLCLQKELKSGHDGTDPGRWKLEGQELKVIPSYMTCSRPAWAIKNLKGTEVVFFFLHKNNCGWWCSSIGRLRFNFQHHINQA